MKQPFVNIPYEFIYKYTAFIKAYHLHLEVYFNARILDSISETELTDNMPFLLPLTMHGPYVDLSPGTEDSKIRSVTLQRFHRTIDVAEILKPQVIVFHSGFDKWRYHGFEHHWLHGSLKVWQEVLKRTEPLGIKIAVENIFEDNPFHLIHLVEKINSPSFGLCFDTGHFNLFSNTSLEEWIAAILPYVIEVHLHDNNGRKDEHLPPEEGTFNFKAFFKLIKEKKPFYTLEVHTPEGVLTGLKWFQGLLKEIDLVPHGKTF